AGADKGAPFVLLDQAVQPAGLQPSEIGLDLNWRIGPQGYDVSDAHFVMLAAAGGMRALRPLSPVHLRGRLDGAGNLALSWVRRGRIDADSWLGEEIPLGETAESYRIDIASTGGEILRTETASEPRWTYLATEMAADFGDPPQAVDVTVRQISAAV